MAHLIEISGKLMARDGADEYGDPTYRLATVDEEHAAWEADLTDWDRAADYHDGAGADQ